MLSEFDVEFKGLSWDHVVKDYPRDNHGKPDYFRHGIVLDQQVRLIKYLMEAYSKWIYEHDEFMFAQRFSELEWSLCQVAKKFKQDHPLTWWLRGAYWEIVRKRDLSTDVKRLDYSIPLSGRISFVTNDPERIALMIKYDPTGRFKHWFNTLSHYDLAIAKNNEKKLLLEVQREQNSVVS